MGGREEYWLAGEESDGEGAREPAGKPTGAARGLAEAAADVGGEPASTLGALSSPLDSSFCRGGATGERGIEGAATEL